MGMPVVLGPIEGVAVEGGGTSFPERVLSNEEVLRLVASHAWPGRVREDDALAFMAKGLEESMGLSSRAWAHVPGTPFDHAREASTLDLAVAAARTALADARVSPSEIALVLCVTSTPSRMTSALATAIGAALGTHAACMDVRTGCSGGLFALTTAALFLAAGTGRVLLVGTETFSKIIPPGSKMAAVALADGAGALVLGRRNGTGLASAALASDGALGRLITTDGALPPTDGEIARGGYTLSGAPDELSNAIPGKYDEAIGAALDRARVSAAELSLFVPHQTSAPLIRAVATRAGIPRERTFLNVHLHANVGAAGWIVAFVEARAAGRVRSGSHVLFAAVGGGMSWAAAVLTC
jgi:3-oxoacyl-[acyl-carrier-protein] synthase-3